MKKLIQKIVRRFQNPFKNKIYFVGGCVRDELLGKEPHDYDLVIESNGGSREFANFIHQLFPNSTSKPIHLNGRYPIYKIVFTKNIELDGENFEVEGEEIEIADSMKEEFPDKNSRQREVSFASLKEDALRRDLTINALFERVIDGKIIDFFNGIEDLKNGILRTPNDPNKTFSDDPLRMLRVLRFELKFGKN